MDNNEIRKVIKQFKQQPLFYLFLSSRELFHSNFWYWLSTINTPETYRLFLKDGPLPDGVLTARREVRKKAKDSATLDLVFYTAGDDRRHHKPILVIENKVKDIATAEQLSRIEDAFIPQEQSHIHFVLATLFKGNDLPPGNKWIELGYDEIEESTFT